MEEALGRLRADPVRRDAGAGDAWRVCNDRDGHRRQGDQNADARASVAEVAQTIPSVSSEMSERMPLHASATSSVRDGNENVAFAQDRDAAAAITASPARDASNCSGNAIWLKTMAGIGIINSRNASGKARMRNAAARHRNRMVPARRSSNEMRVRNSSAPKSPASSRTSPVAITPTPATLGRTGARIRVPEYRAIRETVSFEQLCRSPKLIAEVVRQPVQRFGLDAAILFSDILTVLEPMGMQVSFPNGGPKLANPINTPDDVKRLQDVDVDKSLSFVADAYAEIRKVLPDTPVIGFAGSPWTLACYMIQGKGSNNFDKPKQFLHKYPSAAEELIDLLVKVVTKYLAMQIRSGANAVQLFDSWGGILSKDDYYDWSARPSNQIFRGLKQYDTPRILFVNNVAPYVDIIRDVDCDVVGVDYRTDIADIAAALPGKAVQGNLDPSVLFNTREKVVAQTMQILDSLESHDNLIFNLGHGIQPETPISSVEAIVETVHHYRG